MENIFRFNSKISGFPQKRAKKTYWFGLFKVANDDKLTKELLDEYYGKTCEITIKVLNNLSSFDKSPSQTKKLKKVTK